MTATILSERSDIAHRVPRWSARASLSAAFIAGALVLAPVAGATSAHASPTVAAHHKCTRTSSGKCIKGGQLCPRADYHHSGWNAAGKRYVCKGSKTHPHWELP